MQELLFDHFFSICRDNDLQGTLAHYQKLGMIPDPDITRHGFGNHSGFLLLTGTYIELISFYDKSLWNPKKDPHVTPMVEAGRSYAIALRCADAEKIQQTMIPVFPNSPATFTAGRKDGADTAPIWKFFNFTPEALPGVYCFAVEYLRLATERSRLKPRLAPNSLFFLAGFLFCTDDPASRLQSWSKTLGALGEVKKLTPTKIQMGVQEIEWVNAEDYQKKFGVPWKKISSAYGELAAVIVYAEDLQKVADHYLKHAPHIQLTHHLDSLTLSPDPNTSLAFVVYEKKISDLLPKLQRLNIFKE